MPRATVNIKDTRRFELVSCPGGYVVLRKMTYGQVLQRQEMAMKIQMSAAQGQQNPTMDMKNAHQEVAIYEMRHCVAEHNLTDHEDRPLDFKQAATITLLDPQVGQEIGAYIDQMNQYQPGELGNFSVGSNGSLPTPEPTNVFPQTTLSET